MQGKPWIPEALAICSLVTATLACRSLIDETAFQSLLAQPDGGDGGPVPPAPPDAKDVSQPPLAPFAAYRAPRGAIPYAPSPPRAPLLDAAERASEIIACDDVRTERGGTVNFAAGTFSYSPPAATFWGDDYFCYRARNPLGDTEGLVRITVQPDVASPLPLDSLEGGGGNGFIANGTSRGPQSVAYAGDVNGDGKDDVILGTAQGAFVLFGELEGTFDFEAVRPPGFALQGPFNGQVAAAGDFDCDGLSDLIVGNPDATGATAGAAYVVFGKADTDDISLTILESGRVPGFVISGESAGDRAGSSVAGIGDFNGDGCGDVMVGAPGASSVGVDGVTPLSAGKVYIVFGEPRPLDENGDRRGLGNLNLAGLTASRRGWAFVPSQAEAPVGDMIASAGDFDGDGLDDALIGSPSSSLVGDDTGAVYLVYGLRERPEEDLDLRSFETATTLGGFEFYGISGTRAGSSISPAGDFNGDGFDDFIFSAPGAEGDGAVRIVFGQPRDPTRIPRNPAAQEPGLSIGGITVGSTRTLTTASARDFNGDGYDDVLVAAPGAGLGGVSKGLVGIVLGRSSVAEPELQFLELATLGRGVSFSGASDEDRAGSWVAGAGDANGDGLDDVLIAATRSGQTAGSVYGLYGWDVSDSLGTRQRGLLGPFTSDDAPALALAPIRVAGSGGREPDSLYLGEAPQLSLTVNDRTPRYSSIERIYLTGGSGTTLTIDARTLRQLPQSRIGLDPFSRVLEVYGDPNDQVVVSGAPFEVVRAGLWRAIGAHYGIQLAPSLRSTGLP